MKVSFETPISLLPESAKYNDYDYALVHLFKHPRYLEYYESALRAGRTVILDNSAYELGESFDVESFVFWIEYLLKFTQNPKNLIAVVPDKLHDKSETIWKAMDFQTYVDQLPCRFMYVVQGSDFAERIECAVKIGKFVRDIDLLAVNMTPKRYGGEDFSTASAWVKESKRIEVLDKLCELQENNLLPQVKFHLLGCHNAMCMEFYKTYEKYVRIESMDTSAPIMVGFHRKRINQFEGKFETMFQDIVKTQLDGEQKDLMLKNVDFFKHNILGDRKESPFPETA